MWSHRVTVCTSLVSQCAGMTSPFMPSEFGCSEDLHRCVQRRSSVEAGKGQVALVVWTFLSPGPIWELDWIHEALNTSGQEVMDVVDENLRCSPQAWESGLPQGFGVDAGNTTVILAISENKMRWWSDAAVISCMLRLRMHGWVVGLLQLSDELYSANSFFYSTPDFVVRNHWHTDLSRTWGSHLITIPLGYKTGFNNDLTPLSVNSSGLAVTGGPFESLPQRPLWWNFVGEVGLKPLRKEVGVDKSFIMYPMQTQSFALSSCFRLLRAALEASRTWRTIPDLGMESQGTELNCTPGVCRTLYAGCDGHLSVLDLTKLPPSCLFSGFFVVRCSLCAPPVTACAWQCAPCVLPTVISVPDHALPTGGHTETFRLSEALEAGSIPIAFKFVTVC